MPQASPIADYLAALSRELRFDPALSRRVCAEVEDHLRDAAAAGTGADRERAAVARFGAPGILARQFAAPALLRQARGAGYGAALAVLCSFLAMEFRLAWYVASGWPLGDDRALATIRTVALSIDRSAFALAVIAGLGGLAYGRRARIAAALDGACRSRLRRFFALSALATAALLVTVASDMVLTALRLAESSLRLASLLPITLIATEIAVAALFTVHLRTLARRLEAAFAQFPE